LICNIIANSINKAKSWILGQKEEPVLELQASENGDITFKYTGRMSKIYDLLCNQYKWQDATVFFGSLALVGFGVATASWLVYDLILPEFLAFASVAFLGGISVAAGALAVMIPSVNILGTIASSLGELSLTTANKISSLIPGLNKTLDNKANYELGAFMLIVGSQLMPATLLYGMVSAGALYSCFAEASLDQKNTAPFAHAAASAANLSFA
jgi:hypothetical protein